MSRRRSAAPRKRTTSSPAPSDHNFRFYAYYPYSGATADRKAIAAAAPAEQPYTGRANGGLYTASKSVTTVVPTVELEFRNIFATMELYLPDDLLDEDGNSVVKTLTLKPAVAENFSGALAVSGTYDLTTGAFTENPASRSQQIAVDFGAQGLTLSEAYTKVPLVVAPFTVPEGGFEVTFTDRDDRPEFADDPRQSRGCGPPCWPPARCQSSTSAPATTASSP